MTPDERIDRLEDAIATLTGRIAMLTQQISRFVEASLRSFTELAERHARVEGTLARIDHGLATTDRRLDELEAVIKR